MPVDTARLRFLGLDFSPDGRHVFAWLGPIGVADPAVKTLRAWGAWTGAEVSGPRGEDFPYHPPSVSRDRRWRLECGAPGGGWGAPVRLCDAASGRTLASFEVHEDLNLREAAFSADGRRVVAGGYGEEGGGEVVAWEVSSGRRLAQVYPAHSVGAVALSPDGEHMASGASDGAVQLWEAAGGAPLATLRGHEGSVEALTFAPDGRRLASGSSDGTVRVWDLGRRAAGPRLQGHPDHVQDCVFSTDGRRLVTRSENDTTWLWDAGTGAPVACLHSSSFVVLEGGSASGSVFADGQAVASVAREGGVWAAATGEAMGPQSPELRFSLSCKVLFSPDGRRVAAASGSRGGLRVLEAAGGAEVARLDDGQGLTCMAFSPDGERLASGSEGGTVRVWAVADGSPLGSLRGPDGPVTCVAFAPDGGRVCSGAADRTVRIWDIAAGAQLACVRVDDVGVWSRGWSLARGEWVVRAVRAVAFSADGALVLTQSEGKVQAWDPRSGACVRTFEGAGDLKAIASGAPWPAFVRGPEVVVESADTGEAVAWLPSALGLVPGRGLVTHPAGRTWAGAAGPHLYLFTLEAGGCGAGRAKP
jgi:WD40 repeat protein